MKIHDGVYCCETCGGALTQNEIAHNGYTCNDCLKQEIAKDEFEKIVKTKLNFLAGKFAYEVAQLLSQSLKMEILPTAVANAMDDNGNVACSFDSACLSLPDWARETIIDNFQTHSEAWILELSNGKAEAA